MSNSPWLVQYFSEKRGEWVTCNWGVIYETESDAHRGCRHSEGLWPHKRLRVVSAADLEAEKEKTP